MAEHAHPPLEASGISGMKAALNGVPSLSSLVVDRGSEWTKVHWASDIRPARVKLSIGRR